MRNRVVVETHLQFQEGFELRPFSNPVLAVFQITVRSWPNPKRYTLATIYHGFIRETNILEQCSPMIPPEYLLESFGLLHREPLPITLFIGTFIIRIRCIATGIRDGMVHCLLQMIFVEITHIVVMEINFIVIVRIF